MSSNLVPAEDMIWYDENNNLLMFYNGSNWQSINDFSDLYTKINNINSAFYNNDPLSKPVKRAFYVGSTAPSGAVAGTVWFDTSTNSIKYYDGTNWQRAVIDNAGAISVSSNGYVGIGIAPTGYKLSIGGAPYQSLYITGATTRQGIILENTATSGGDNQTVLSFYNYDGQGISMLGQLVAYDANSQYIQPNILQLNTVRSSGGILFKTNQMPRMFITAVGNVGINTTAPNSTLNCYGSLALATTTKTSNYTLTATDYIILGDASAGPITFNLPTAVGISGRIYEFVKIDSSSNAITIDGAGSETINGALTKTLTTQWQRCRIVSNNSNWIVLSE
jgi:hypothetical protein